MMLEETGGVADSMDTGPFSTDSIFYVEEINLNHSSSWPISIIQDEYSYSLYIVLS